MIHRDDIWKVLTGLGAIVAAIAAHTIKLPPAWEFLMPYIEFASGAYAVVMAFMVKPNGGTQ